MGRRKGGGARGVCGTTYRGYSGKIQPHYLPVPDGGVHVWGHQVSLACWSEGTAGAHAIASASSVEVSGVW